MKDITKNEINMALMIFKDFTNNYNANNIAKATNLTPMGALKILNKLEYQKIIMYQQIGKAKIAHINYTNEYTKQYLAFLLRTEAEQSTPEVKRWTRELRKLNKNANIGILFGSVINKTTFNDIDVLLTIRPSNLKDLSKQLDELNSINIKRIHAIKQSKTDLKENLLKKDKIILQAIKTGIVTFGYEELIEVIMHVAHRT